MNAVDKRFVIKYFINIVILPTEVLKEMLEHSERMPLLRGLFAVGLTTFVLDEQPLATSNRQKGKQL